MSKDQRPKFQDGSKAALFLELADPDDLGFSRKVSTAEFVGKYRDLLFGNGGDWIRKSTKLARYYNIHRHPPGRGNTISENSCRITGFYEMRFRTAQTK